MAKKSLRGRWTDAVIFALLYSLIMAAINSLAGGRLESNRLTTMNWVFMTIQMLVSGAFAYGLDKYYLYIAKGIKVGFGMLVDGFSQFGKVFVLWLLMALKVFAWSLLFVVPGIIATIRYSQAWRILIDNPKMTPSEAIQASCEMMQGHKMDYFILGLSFIGWVVVSILTFGIGFFWLLPYADVTASHFYLDIRPNIVEKIKAKVLKQESDAD